MAPRAEPIHLNPATTLGCAVSSTVHECVIHIVRSADYARKSDDPEGIHQLRVSIRRLRAALSIFRLLEPGRRRPAVASKLRALQQELSAAREWDVLIEETIGSVRQRLRDWQGLNRLIKGAEAKRAKAYQLAQAALRDTRYTDLLLELESRIDRYFGLSMSRSRKAARKIALTSPAASFAVDVFAQSPHEGTSPRQEASQAQPTGAPRVAHPYQEAALCLLPRPMAWVASRTLPVRAENAAAGARYGARRECGYQPHRRGRTERRPRC
jgi:CHAD domain-containing protein